MIRAIGRCVRGFGAATLLAAMAAGCAGGANEKAAATGKPSDPAARMQASNRSTEAPIANRPPGGSGGSAVSSIDVTGGGGAGGPSAAPAIPAGAQWTIFCESISTEDHFARANALKDALVKNSRASGWYVLHTADRSTLYLGYYREIDPKSAPDAAARTDAQRAQRDKQVVEGIPGPNGTGRLFPRAQFTQLEAPDPDAPKGWDLADAKGYWSVQIAAYTGPQRKQAAVESVRAARESGVEAYYYHGPSLSSVCVGAWPADALKRQDAAKAGTSDEDPNAVIYLNLTGEKLTDEQKAAIGKGGEVREFTVRVDVADPTLKKTLKDYPEHSVDGMVQMMRMNDKTTGKTVLKPRPTFIVQIPRAGPSPYDGRDDAGDRPAGPSPDLTNRLRGLGR